MLIRHSAGGGLGMSVGSSELALASSQSVRHAQLPRMAAAVAAGHCCFDAVLSGNPVLVAGQRRTVASSKGRQAKTHMHMLKKSSQIIELPAVRPIIRSS